METIQSQPTRAAFTYLKAIYDCGDGDRFVTTSQLADYLKVAPASVTAMSQKLAAFDPPLLEYHKHHGVRLLPVGEQYALRIIRRHRLVETFLIQALGYSWDEVHEEAEELDSCISPRLEERLARYTGNPAFNPHGAPIPADDLSLPQVASISLNQLAAGQKGQVIRVCSADSGLLRYLGGLGITLGALIEVVNCVPYDGTMQVRINQTADPVSLGPSLTSVILLGA
jgi:DtxR family transcriptional regulator, Mn-dependent transcriptional regulator